MTDYLRHLPLTHTTDSANGNRRVGIDKVEVNGETLTVRYSVSVDTSYPHQSKISSAVWSNGAWETLVTVDGADIDVVTDPSRSGPTRDLQDHFENVEHLLIVRTDIVLRAITA